MKKFVMSFFICMILTRQNVLAHNQEHNSVYSNFCALVTEAMTHTRDAKSGHDYIVNHFDEQVGSEVIKDAYEVVFQVAPDKRYSVFKESIEEEMGSKWECASLKEYFNYYVKQSSDK